MRLSVRKDLVKHIHSRDTDRNPQRTGWLDAVMLRYSNMINGFSRSVSISLFLVCISHLCDRLFAKTTRGYAIAKMTTRCAQCMSVLKIVCMHKIS